MSRCTYIDLIQGGGCMGDRDLAILHTPCLACARHRCNSIRWQSWLEWETQEWAMEERVVATWNLKWFRKWDLESGKFLTGEKQKLIGLACSPILLKNPDNIYLFVRQCTCNYLELALNDINCNALKLSSFFFLISYVYSCGDFRLQILVKLKI